MADAIMSMALLNHVAFFYQAQSNAIGISNMVLSENGHVLNIQDVFLKHLLNGPFSLKANFT